MKTISEYLIHADTGQELILEHHGILGQKWGVRRFQNPDGSLTAEGRERYGVGSRTKSSGTLSGSTNSGQKKSLSQKIDSIPNNIAQKLMPKDTSQLSDEEFQRKYGMTKGERWKHEQDNSTWVIVGAGIAGLVVATAVIDSAYVATGKRVLDKAVDDGVFEDLQVDMLDKAYSELIKQAEKWDSKLENAGARVDQAQEFAKQYVREAVDAFNDGLAKGRAAGERVRDAFGNAIDNAADGIFENMYDVGENMYDRFGEEAFNRAAEYEKRRQEAIEARRNKRRA